LIYSKYIKLYLQGYKNLAGNISFKPIPFSTEREIIEPKKTGHYCPVLYLCIANAKPGTPETAVAKPI
jgi:hypothetical protein